MVLEQLDVLRLAIWREPHDLVFAGIDSEACEVGERRIEKAQRVRKTQLAQHLDVRPTPYADRRGRPFANAVHRDDRGLLERRRVERRRGVRFVMVAEVHFTLVAVEPLLDVGGHPEFLAEPQRHRHQERPPAARCARGVGFEQAVELDQRLLVEADEIEILRRDAALTEAVGGRPRRKARVVLLAREAFFLCGGHDPAVFDETGGRIVIVGRDSENPCRHQNSV